MKLEEDNLGFLLTDVTRLLRRVAEKRLQGSSLTLSQARALKYIAINEGVRQVELAELLEIQPMTLARQIDLLAEAGLVERRPDPKDRRAHLIYLTEQADAQLEVIKQMSRGVRQDALAGLTDEQADILRFALYHMHQNLARLA
ncbi:Transcriptional regulator SlyA [Thalassocella blandensis]|nr:Transcriptional regulator SlyA [Thalassocella blandensis]